MKFKCSVCGFIHDELKEKQDWSSLPATWCCPICGVGKDLFQPIAELDAPTEKNDAKAAGTESDETKLLRTASDLIAETLRNFGVRCVFGMVGHSNLGMADAIQRLCRRGEMTFVSVRHEGAAAFAAAAYGKLTGMPAACLTIAGPGTTNLITGLADATLDRAPVIVLTGQVPNSELGRNAFQELDLVRVLGVVTCSQQIVSAQTDFSAMTVRACRQAILSRGVSQIVLPDDVQSLAVPADAPAGTPEGWLFNGIAASASETALDAATVLLAKAKHPFVVVGDGCRHALAETLEFVETLNASVATTYRAKGFISDAFPLACGVVGRSGTPVAAKQMAESDCIIGLGTSFSNHSEIARGKTTVQIDRDPAAIGRLRQVDCGVVGELSEILPKLTRGLRGNISAINPRERIASLWEEWRKEKLNRAQKSTHGRIVPADLCNALSACVPANAILSVDVGNVAYAFGRYFETKHQRTLLSFYLGSIGVGLPAAMGAWCATQNNAALGKRPIVAIVGDGGIGQYLAEWTSIVRCGMDVKCVVFNNSELAKISLEQRHAHLSVWETQLQNPSFAAFAQLCGSAGIRIDNPETLHESLARAMAIPGPVLIEVLTDPVAV